MSTTQGHLPYLGGCFCGAVRYRVTGTPALSLLCFCGDCLKFSGGGYPGMMVSTEDFEHECGDTTAHQKTGRSGRAVLRHFCPACGTNLWGETELGLISVAAGTLDNPAAFEPTRVVFTADAPAWARIPPGLDVES